MFEGLKKKLSDAVKIFAKKEEKEIEEKEKVEAAAPAAIAPEPRTPEPEPKPAPETKQAPPQAHEAQKPAQKVRSEQPEEHRKEEIVKLSLKTRIKSVFVGTVTLSDNEIEDFLENVRVSLLESDVSYDTTDAFLADLGKTLRETKVDSKHIQQELLGAVRQSLFDILESGKKGVDVMQFVKGRINESNIPVKILFLGPNGTGKTTTMAKIAYNFKKNGITCVLSASDTFRAAAIEQTEHHANKVGVPVIKSTYGADPASIAFDAIAYAKARGIHAVLIDSAGRQETNKNLINEMQKMVRVAKPDLTIFVGESIAGNQLSEQIKEFNKFMSIDGIILTKLDADAKGGNAISIAHVTGIPLLYLGTGESYDALVPYTPDFIVNAILPNN